MPDQPPAPRVITWLVAQRERLEAHWQFTVVAVAAIVFLLGALSPPSLMDDMDSVHAAIARTMLRSGDWVTARIDGVVYLDKAPMTTWLIATSFALFGIHDWAARLPLALCAILLCWVTARFARWAFSPSAALYSGIALATCAGLYLFTRILIPEVILTLAVTLALWAFLRLIEEDDDAEPRPALWALVLGAALGAGLLLKGLLGIVAPGGAIFLYLVLTRQLSSLAVWKRLRPHYWLGIALLIAAPWYTLATLSNPPYFDFALHSESGSYRGFFWRYFINEHLLRFLGLRYPADYNTVPLGFFWLGHLVWLFPWSAYLPAAAQLSYRTIARPINRAIDRAGRVRLMALCWAGFLLAFFSFSTSQEYYTLPIYPALALLIGSAVAEGGPWVRRGRYFASGLMAFCALVAAAILFAVRSLPAEGEIFSALTQNPDAYTLSLGHMNDLTLASFAWLRLPLLLAVIAFSIGALSAWTFRGRASWAGWVLMMILFTSAARMAMVVFDPYLSSRPLAEALRKSPPGQMIVNGAYYPFSSVFFYADPFYAGHEGLMLNGRFNNLEYGSDAPGAPDVFIKDAQFVSLWEGPRRQYILSFQEEIPKLERLVGAGRLFVVHESSGKALLTNQPLP